MIIAFLMVCALVVGIFYLIFTHPTQEGIVVAMQNPHAGSLGDKVVDIQVLTKSSGNVTVFGVSNCFRLGDNISVSQDLEGGWVIQTPDISGSC